MPQHNWDPKAAAVFADMDAEELFGADPTLYDAHHWARFPYWTLDEATALSFNKNPDIVQATFLKDLPHEFAEMYSDRMTLLERAVAKGQLSDKASPVEIVSWMDKIGLDISNELFDAVRNKTAVKPSQPKRPGDRTKSENVSLKIILGMAIAKYGYTRPADLNAANDMAASVGYQIHQNLKLKVAEATIVKRLKDAYENFYDDIKW